MSTFRVLVISIVLGPLAVFGSSNASAEPRSRLDAIAVPRASQSVDFMLGLPLRNEAGLDALIRNQTDPRSPLYRHFLTSAQFRDAFGPTPASVASATDAARRAGLEIVRTTTQVLFVRSHVANLEQRFGTRMAIVRDRSTGAVAIKSYKAPALSAELAKMGIRIVGLEPIAPRPKFARSLPQSRRGPTGAYWFTDLKQAYDFPAYAEGRVDGTGRTLGNVIDRDISQADMDVYFNHEHLPKPQITTFYPLDPGNSFDPSFGGSGEATLDVQQMGGMAPHAKIIVFNIGPLFDSNVLRGYIDVVENNVVDLVNSSFGGCELAYLPAYNNGQDFTGILRVFHDVFRQGNALGITFVTGSGDHGSQQCTNVAGTRTVPSVSTSADDPNVTAVGGTNLVTTAVGDVDPRPPTDARDRFSLHSEYVRENAVDDPEMGLPGEVWGSGGGYSVVFPEPDYQRLVGTGAPGRAVPDISLHMGGCPSDSNYPPDGTGKCPPDRSADIEILGGLRFGVIGTSASSPDFVGLMALKEQIAGGTRAGNENPDIYLKAAQQANRSATFYRRNIPGANGAYVTRPSAAYDPVIGVGTPFANAFVGLPTSFAGDPWSRTNP